MRVSHERKGCGTAVAAAQRTRGRRDNAEPDTGSGGSDGDEDGPALGQQPAAAGGQTRQVGRRGSGG
eukprot:SAG22_NODE_4222_length_1337_cov_1.638126_1_plen_66_part_10